jgi:hypothetical protein
MRKIGSVLPLLMVGGGERDIEDFLCLVPHMFAIMLLMLFPICC